MYRGLANYDEDDYRNERDCFIMKAQQEVWDLWLGRLTQSRKLDDELKLEIVTIVEEWTGHLFMLDIPIPARLEIDIPF